MLPVIRGDLWRSPRRVPSDKLVDPFSNPTFPTAYRIEPFPDPVFAARFCAVTRTEVSVREFVAGVEALVRDVIERMGGYTHDGWKVRIPVTPGAPLWADTFTAPHAPSGSPQSWSRSPE